VRHIVITAILGLVSVLTFTFPAANQYAQTPMRSSSMPTAMPAPSVSRNLPPRAGKNPLSGGAAVMAPTPLPKTPGATTGHPQLPPMSDDPSLAK
jgi:hypothetical protein